MELFKKLLLLFCFLRLAVPAAEAQDIITKKTGEDIRALVIEVGLNEVKYRIFDNQSGPIYVLAKKDILIIRYQNGNKDIFPETQQEPAVAVADEDSVVYAAPVKPKEDLQQQGAQDARMNYTGSRSGAGWVAATNIITSPIIGLIPAAACASSEPMPQNLNAPDPKLMNNYSYQRAYTEEAHKIKKRAIWSSYGTSSIVWLLLVVILY
jgi:hypothetical protein